MPVKKAASLLNLAVQTMYGMTSRREIPFYKKGKRLYLKKSELLEGIEEGKKKSRAEIAKDAENFLKVKNNFKA
ncbi:MAG: helix-turn-helix domain-containing protein [Bacteroidota bacterium]